MWRLSIDKYALGDAFGDCVPSAFIVEDVQRESGLEPATLSFKRTTPYQLS